MSVVRLQALDRLRQQLEDAVPDLVGKVKIVQVPPDKPVTFPSLAIVAASHPLVPEIEEEEDRIDETSICACVGHWEVTVQLRLAHATPAQRNDIQEQIWQAFCQRPGATGVLISQVTADDFGGDFFASWSMDSDEWNDEMAFSSQYWSTTTLTGWVPALVIRNGIYSLDELQLALVHDFGTADGMASFTNLVDIGPDGTVTPVQQ